MTTVKIEPARTLVNFLRAKISDVNGSRNGQWIVDHFPRLSNLGDAEFPRIAVTIITESADRLGMFDDTMYHNIVFQIDVITKKDLSFTKTVTAEALGTMASTANTNRMTYNYVPNVVTNIKHTSTNYGTLTSKNTDALFTTPTSLAAGTVEYSLSTGNLNFSSADVTSHNGEAITSTYTVMLEGLKLVQYLAREILKAIRGYWRTDATMNGLFYPVILNNMPQPFEQEFGFFRQTIELQVKAFNIREAQ